MSRIEKIKSVLQSLGYSPDMTVRFTLRRFEKVDRIHTNAKVKSEEQLKERFELFNNRYDMKIVGDNFPSSSGQLKVKNFFEFLEEYDEKFNLDWCEIEFKEITIKLAYL
jgi:hypothetical protein